MNTKKLTLAGRLVLVLVLLLAACGDSGAPSSTEEQREEPAEQAAPTSVDRVRLAGLSRFGYPSPFAWVRGPGWLVTGYVFDTLLWEELHG